VVARAQQDEILEAVAGGVVHGRVVPGATGPLARDVRDLAADLSQAVSVSALSHRGM